MSCSNLLTLLAVSRILPAFGTSCSCTGSNKGIDVSKFGADYGTRCAAWEDGSTYPQNSASCATRNDAGAWCCLAWCYVDASTCDATETPFFSSLVSLSASTATWERLEASNAQSLFFSFAACDNATEAERVFDHQTCPFQGSYEYSSPKAWVLVKVRDFDDSHPHFGCEGCFSPQQRGGVVLGMVSSDLDVDGKPRLSSTYSPAYSNFHQAAFKEWYSDQQPIYSFALAFRQGTGAKEGYFIIDSTDYTPLGYRQGLFTTEIRIFFRYNGGEVFDLRGDDDIWVFVNNKLVVDIGGCHGPAPGQVSLDSVASSIGLVKNSNYELVVFQAERCYGASNFRAEFTISLDQGVCPNQCYSSAGGGECNLTLGQCECSPGWAGVDCGMPPTTTTSTSSFTSSSTGTNTTSTATASSTTTTTSTNSSTTSSASTSTSSFTTSTTSTNSSTTSSTSTSTSSPTSTATSITISTSSSSTVTALTRTTTRITNTKTSTAAHLAVTHGTLVETDSCLTKEDLYPLLWLAMCSHALAVIIGWLFCPRHMRCACCNDCCNRTDSISNVSDNASKGSVVEPSDQATVVVADHLKPPPSRPPPSPRMRSPEGPPPEVERPSLPRISLTLPADSLPQNSFQQLSSPRSPRPPTCSPRPPPMIPKLSLPKPSSQPTRADAGIQFCPSVVEVATRTEQLIAFDIGVQSSPTVIDAMTSTSAFQSPVDARASVVDVGVQFSFVAPMVDADTMVDTVTMLDVATMADAVLTCDVEVQQIQTVVDNSTQIDTALLVDSASQTESPISAETLREAFQSKNFGELQLVDGKLQVSLSQDAKKSLGMKPRTFHKHEQQTQTPDAFFEDEAAAHSTLSGVIQLAEACRGELTVSYDQSYRPAEDQDRARHESWLEDLAHNRTTLVEGTVRSMAKPDVTIVRESCINLRPGRRIIVDWQFLLTGDGVDSVYFAWQQEYGERKQRDQPTASSEAGDSGPPLPMKAPPAPPSYAAPRGRRRSL